MKRCGCAYRLKHKAENDNKWLLFNVQDPTVFASLQLNADLWSNELVQDVVKGSFVFAQRILPDQDARQLQVREAINRDKHCLQCMHFQWHHEYHTRVADSHGAHIGRRVILAFYSPVCCLTTIRVDTFGAAACQ